MPAVLLMVTGALAVTAGVALICGPAGLIVGGLLLLLAGWDLSRPDPAAEAS